MDRSVVTLFGPVTVVCLILLFGAIAAHSAQTHPVVFFGRRPLIASGLLITARDRPVLVDAPVMPRGVPAKEGSWSRDCTKPVQPSTST